MTIAKARTFLAQKLRETVGEYAVPALAAVLVRDAGDTIVAGQEGIRKVGARGTDNAIQSTDKFDLGSVTKVFTGALMGKLIHEGIGGLEWRTRLVDVFPELQNLSGWQPAYAAITLEQLVTHTSGLRYEPTANDSEEYKTWPPSELTKPKLMQHRQQYVRDAVVDAPIFGPGSGLAYGGGGIICAAMAERRTGKTYEDLAQEYLYRPLGMTNSGFGVLSQGQLNGPWQHQWNPESRTITPDQDTMKPAFNWHPRMPVGGACCSAADMGKFLREQLRPDPQLVPLDARASLQRGRLGPVHVRGGWSAQILDSAISEIAHNGDNGVSYAHIIVSLTKHMAHGAMTNVNSTLGGPAVGEMLEVLRAMDRHWGLLFDDPATSFVECAHPRPAVTFAGNKAFLFARKHTGAMVRVRGTAFAFGYSWEGPVEFPAAVFTSGLAAAASSSGQRIVVMGRGTDNQLWWCSSSDGGDTWQGWRAIGGTFLSGPALTMSSNGNVLHAFATGTDQRIWRCRSLDGGESWAACEPIGQGVFTSAPAAAASQDGKIVHVFGRGTDYRIWHNRSLNSAGNWEPHWKPIGNGIFSSSPAAGILANGSKIHVIGRGMDRALWRNVGDNAGDGWLAHWEPIPGGSFTSAPTLDVSGDGSQLLAVAIDGDFHLHQNGSLDGGASWTGWGLVGSDIYL
jgi:CubicO group peptidase (beta-lactamase class C family)